MMKHDETMWNCWPWQCNIEPKVSFFLAVAKWGTDQNHRSKLLFRLLKVAVAGRFGSSLGTLGQWLLWLPCSKTSHFGKLIYPPSILGGIRLQTNPYHTPNLTQGTPRHLRFSDRFPKQPSLFTLLGERHLVSADQWRLGCRVLQEGLLYSG